MDKNNLSVFEIMSRNQNKSKNKASSSLNFVMERKALKVTPKRSIFLDVIVNARCKY